MFVRGKPGFEPPAAWEGIETTGHYRPGGYHPVHLHDKLNDRFEVIHKLGFGGFATIWLCWDAKNRIWVAVKIIQACVSNEQRPEIKLINALKADPDFDLEDWGRAGVILPSEQFWLDGPNGRHLCEVLPVLGPLLYDQWHYGMSLEELPMMKELLYQVVSGLNFLHKKGICHGDFRPANILMQVEDLDVMEKDELIDLLGPPQLVGAPNREGCPAYLVKSAKLDALKVKNKIAIIDLGEAFRPSNPPEHFGIPEMYRAPEAYLLIQPSFPSDIWSLACTLQEVRVFFPMFGTETYDEVFFCQLEVMLGPMPLKYRSAWLKLRRHLLTKRLESKRQQRLEERGEYTSSDEGEDEKWLKKMEKDIPCEEATYNEDGELEYISSAWGVEEVEGQNAREEEDTPGYSTMVDRRLARKVNYHRDEVPQPLSVPSDEEVRVLGDLLRKMIKWLPEERIGLEEVLNHEWFQDRFSVVGPDYKPVYGEPHDYDAWVAKMKADEAAEMEKLGISFEDDDNYADPPDLNSQPSRPTPEREQIPPKPKSKHELRFPFSIICSSFSNLMSLIHSFDTNLRICDLQNILSPKTLLSKSHILDFTIGFLLASCVGIGMLITIYSLSNASIPPSSITKPTSQVLSTAKSSASTYANATLGFITQQSSAGRSCPESQVGIQNNAVCICSIGGWVGYSDMYIK
ncbi:kinase-like domain-containing protein [Xylariaceae sp. FL0255]|nr:kinase-like domain-containing protein [Xylariaceae sp. FL0255]